VFLFALLPEVRHVAFTNGRVCLSVALAMVAAIEFTNFFVTVVPLEALFTLAATVFQTLAVVAAAFRTALEVALRAIELFGTQTETVDSQPAVLTLFSSTAVDARESLLAVALAFLAFTVL